jgi:NAD(P)-dependent dehydrogenase (short-subunit alcohol dehydrogenase family)
MTDLRDKTILVTGATDGLGKGIVLALARGGATILVHGRDQARIDAAASEARRQGAGAVRAHKGDLASLSDVRRLAAEVLSREDRLDVLVNNAGIGTEVPGGPARAQSKDGRSSRDRSSCPRQSARSKKAWRRRCG